jgi:hypothetical protein
MREGAPYIAVGTHGSALVRLEAGVWRAEQTGTDKDLFAVWHEGTTTVAVGAGGTMVQRSPEGAWRPVKTRTTADLYGINGGNVVGAGGIRLECRGDDKEPVCIPQPAIVPRDLYAVSKEGYHIGDGALLSFMKGPKGELTLRPVGGRVDFVPADDRMRAVWSNRTEDEMHEQIVVGLGGAVWFVSEPYSRKKAFERVQLPFGADLHGVAFELFDGFLVGDKGTIVHLAVDGIEIPTGVLL